ncbi:MAG: S4 domain-containing protein [Bacteroidales bacterium]|jgi:ribosome-associated heat shock protein Hsp15|nr:S4 domain-containing protein [Bacteroidales bacterium]
MTDTKAIRIDKYLWAVRLFKTRSAATEACRKGRVLIGEAPVKPSRNVSPGDTILVKRMPVVYTYLITKLTDKRVSARLVPEYCVDVTPEAERNKLLASRMTGSYALREKGAGRPTKRERRDLENMFEELLNQDN